MRRSTAINFIRRHKRPLAGTLVGILAVGTFMLAPHVAHASGFTDAIMSVLANITYALIQFVANLLVVVVNIMVSVAQYSKFLGVPAVEKGWAIVRDVCNMFFIVVLLIISFGTILRLENYRYNRLLARLIVMAVLVNFSKFIAGFLIDFAQVVMLTFVNAWRDIAAGNITSALGLQDIVSVSREQNLSPTTINNVGPILTALLLGLFLVTVAAIVMTIIAITLILRILALWFLIVLSPLAFLLKTYPSTEKYAARWWQEFGKYAVTGPVVAFLLWLTLAIIAQPTNLASDVFVHVNTTESSSLLTTPVTSNTGDTTTDSSPEAHISAAITSIGDSEKLLSYMIGIMLLVGTLVITKELGTAGGQIAGQWADKIKGFATKAAVVGGAAVTGAGFAGAAGAAGGMFAVTGGKRSIQLAGTGLKAGAGFLGRKADELSIRAQTGQGRFGRAMQRFVPKRLQEHPISFRPSMIKKAYQDYRHRREEGIYGKVATGGMVDMMNYVMSRGKDRTDFAYMAEMQEIKKKKGERSAGGTRKERLLSDLKTFLDFKKDAAGKITGAEIKTGKESDVEAIMHLLTANHDLNEMVKDQDIRAYLQTLLPEGDDIERAGEVTPENIQRLVSGLFGHHAARVAMDIGEIGFANNDPWLYSMTRMTKEGKAELLSGITKAQDEGQDYNKLNRFNVASAGMTWQEFSRQETAAGRGDELKKYRDYYDALAKDEQGDIMAGYNAKRENRQIATKMRRQDLFTEFGIGRGGLGFRRGLHSLGQKLLRDVLSNMTDYGFATGETKTMLQQRVDVLKAFADTGSSDATKREAALQKYKTLTGGEMPTVAVNEEQRAGIYRLISFILGKDGGGYNKLADTYKTNDEMGMALDQMIEQYMGTDADGSQHSAASYAQYENRYNQLIGQNREFFDDSTKSEKEHEDRQAELRAQAAREAGFAPGFTPKVGPPVGIKDPTRDELGLPATPASAGAATGSGRTTSTPATPRPDDDGAAGTASPATRSPATPVDDTHAEHSGTVADAAEELDADDVSMPPSELQSMVAELRNLNTNLTTVAEGIHTGNSSMSQVMNALVDKVGKANGAEATRDIKAMIDALRQGSAERSGEYGMMSDEQISRELLKRIHEELRHMNERHESGSTGTSGSAGNDRPAEADNPETNE